MKKQILTLLLVIACGAATTSHAQTQTLRIVSASENAVIQTDTASPVEKYAALELQRAIRIMTGTQLNIIHKDVTTSLGKIIIGTPATNTRVASAATVLQLTGGGNEKIAVKKEGYILYLAGNTTRAALYATYTFLDSLGARWYWPDSTGEFLPHRDSIVINYSLFISKTPHLDVRSMAITGSRTTSTEYLFEETDKWMARNRLNWISNGGGTSETLIARRREKGFLIRRAGHNVGAPNEIITTSRMQGADSVLAALVNGVRRTGGTISSPEHMCWSNPRGWDSVAKMLVGWWNVSPFPDVIHFYPSDNQRYCQCTNCVNMALPEDGDNTNNITRRWQRFSDSVIKRAKVLQQSMTCTLPPGGTVNNLRCKEFWTYAYWDYKNAPTVAAAPFDLIPYAMMATCYRHLLTTGVDNTAEIDEVDAWLNLSPARKMGVRGYEFIPFKLPMQVQNVTWVVDQMKWIKRKGMSAYMSEIPFYGSPVSNPEPEMKWWNASRVSIYAATRAMWDTAVVGNNIVSDLSTRVYGAAGADMNNYYRDMDSAWRAGTDRITQFLRTPGLYIDNYLSAPLFHKEYKRFADAFDKIENDSSLDSANFKRIENEILLERELLDNWTDTFLFRESRMSRYNIDILPRVNGVNSTILPTFEQSYKTNASVGTTVSAGWTSGYLHLRITPPEQSLVVNPGGNLPRNDSQSFTDGFEIFVQPDSSRPEFYRVRINQSQGNYSDAKTYSGIQFDNSWNATNAIWVGTSGPSTLVYNIQISFTSLGINPVADVTKFKLGIRRKASSGGTFTGWPEAESNYVGLFSPVTIVSDNNGLIVKDTIKK